MLNFDQVGSRNLDKLPTNSVNWVLAMLVKLEKLEKVTIEMAHWIRLEKFYHIKQSNKFRCFISDYLRLLIT